MTIELRVTDCKLQSISLSQFTVLTVTVHLFTEFTHSLGPPGLPDSEESPFDPESL